MAKLIQLNNSEKKGLQRELQTGLKNQKTHLLFQCCFLLSE